MARIRTVRVPLATPAEVAEHVGVTPKTLENWRAREEGPPFIRVSGKRPRYRWADVEQWLAARTIETF